MIITRTLVFERVLFHLEISHEGACIIIGNFITLQFYWRQKEV